MVRAIFMGSPAFAVPALEALVAEKYYIAAVYTQPDKKGGRGQQLVACPVKAAAMRYDLKAVQPERINDASELEYISALNPDIIVVAAYGKILPDEILTMPRHRCINIHPSLLPKYRGPSPVAAAILNGDPTTGVTIMLVETKVDSGPILNQREEPVLAQDTTESLSDRLSRVGARLLVETIPGWVEGNIRPIKQDDSRAAYTRMITKEDGRLDWSEDAVQLWRKTRAYFPWPGCYFPWKGMRVKVSKAVPVNAGARGPNGLVAELVDAPARLAVQTSDGLLGLLSLQPEGKREMPAADFLAGHRNFVGSLLT
jgi:methionyl-tRNA formyltransferase